MALARISTTAPKGLRTRPALGLGLLVSLAAVFSLCAGYVWYAPVEAARALFAFDGSQTHHVILTLRLPRTMIALLVGASLGAAGVLAQTLTRNPVAAPDILGLNAGAALAVVTASLWIGVEGLTGLSLAAAAGAAAAGLVVFTVARLGGGLGPDRVLLVGVTFAGLGAALVQIALLADEATLDRLLLWLVGTFEGRPLGLAASGGALLLLGFLAALMVARPLDVIRADEETARSVGAPVALVRGVAFLALAALTGGAVAMAGPVAFLGLIAPHGARALVGSDHRPQIVAAALLGALIAVLADVAARFIIYPEELPAGVVIALIGGPAFLMLLRRRLG